MALSVVIELSIIALQALRGTTSHYNQTTSFDGTLFSIMGNFVILLWCLHLVTSVLLLIERLPERPMAAGLALGLVVTAIGMAIAGTMLPRGAHTVGMPDGGPGLPFLGWSTIAGDLRVSHFFGLHALQVIPLAAYMIDVRRG